MKQPTSIGMKKGTNLETFPHHLCHPDWEQSGKTPLSCSQSTRELPSFPLRLRNSFAGQAEQDQFLKNCSGPGGALPPLSHTSAVRRMCVAPWAPLTVRMPGEAEKHSQGKARGSFAPVFQHRTAVPNHRLLQHLLIPLWVCPHAHCCVRLDTTHSSTHTEGKKLLAPKGQGFHTLVPEQIRGFSTAGIFCRQPWATAGAWRDSRPAHLLAALIATWHFKRLAYFLPCQGALLRHSSPVRSKAFPSAKLHSSAANYCRSGKQRKEQVKLESGNDTGVRIPSQLYSGPCASSRRLSIRYLESVLMWCARSLQ